MNSRMTPAALATVAASMLLLSGPVAADGMPRRAGSIKDPPVAAAPPRHCYVRADVGYGWSASDNAFATISPAGIGVGSGRVQDSSLDGAWFAEIGAGCSFFSSGHGGLRGDVTFGFHGERDFHGVPVNPPAPPPNFVDPVSAKVHASTLMFNVYYDMPAFHRFTPYVGAGIGAAFVDLKDTAFTNGTVVRLPDHDETSLAWSLMAGVGTDLGSGIVLDVGYRYLNLGEISVGSAAVGYNLKVNDLSEHQVKVGVRIPIGF